MIEIPMERWLARYEDIEPMTLELGALQDRLNQFIADAFTRLQGARRLTYWPPSHSSGKLK